MKKLEIIEDTVNVLKYFALWFKIKIKFDVKTKMSMKCENIIKKSEIIENF